MSKKTQAYVTSLIESIAMATGESSVKRIAYYVAQIMNFDKITYEKLSKVEDKLASSFPKFPPLSELIEFIHREKTTSKQYKKSNDYEQEQNKLEKIIEKFLPIVGQNGIDKYLIYWCKKMMGDNFLDLVTNAGLTTNIFLKAAMFDLDEAEGDIKRAIEIGHRKQQKVSAC